MEIVKPRFKSFVNATWIAFGVVVALLVGSPSNAQAGAKLKADYQFKGNYKSSVHGAPSLKRIGSGMKFAKQRVPGSGKRKVLKFPDGTGLGLDTRKLIPDRKYSVILEFKFHEIGVDDYFRILNPTRKSDDIDHGFYIDRDHLDYFDETSNPGTKVFAQDKYYEVALTRSKSGQTRMYVNGKHDLTYEDNSTGDGEIRDKLLRFFKDNDNDEESAGAVARIRAYSGPLSGSKVKKIYNKGH